ncbi:Uncharacterised protein [Yersinia massiliensis]|nr:Uncharacterised protein [Yersinia massiliensis]
MKKLTLDYPQDYIGYHVILNCELTEKDKFLFVFNRIAFFYVRGKTNVNLIYVLTHTST